MREVMSMPASPSPAPVEVESPEPAEVESPEPEAPRNGPARSQFYSRAFWLAVFERMVRAFVAALVGFLSIGATADTALNIATVGWVTALQVSAGAALMSALMSVLASGIGSSGPGLTVETLPADK